LIERFSSESARVTLRELDKIKLTTMNLETKSKKQITEISQELSNIFKELKIPQPTRWLQ